MSRKTDLYVGIVLLIIVLLDMVGILRFVGITGRFVDIVAIAVAFYLILKGRF